MKEELYFSNSQNRILDVHKLYSNEGVCNIGARLKFVGAYQEEDVLDVLNTFFSNIPILKIRMNQEYVPYMSTENPHIYEWNGNKNPEMAELREWLTKPFQGHDSFLYEVSYNIFDEYIEVYIKMHHILVDSYSVLIGVEKLNNVFSKKRNGNKISFEADYRPIESMKIRPLNDPKSIEWFEKKYHESNAKESLSYSIASSKLDSDRFSFNLSPEIYAGIKKIEKQKGYSVEVQFATILSVYFAACNMSNTFCFGRTMLNRKKTDRYDIVMKANSLPVFMNLENFNTFEDVCRYVRSYFFGMYRHCDISQKVIEKKVNLSGAFYNQIISYRRLDMIPSCSGVLQEEIWNYKSEMPLKWYIDEYENGITIDIQYQSAIFEKHQIQDIISRLECLFFQLFNNIELKSACFITEKDKTIINKTSVESPVYDNKLLPQLILNQIKINPKLVAYSCNKGDLSYEELGIKSRQVAGWLISNGVTRGDIVGVCLPSSLEVAYVFLGIWRAGAAFLPISPAENIERKEELIKDCKLCIQKKDIESFSKHDISSDADITLEDTAYCMCTSGSSGASKIVKISHDSLARRVFWMNDMWSCSKSVLQNAAYTFDVSMWQYFVPVAYGGHAYILKDEYRSNPERITKIIKEHKIETLHFIPTMLSIWGKYIEEHKVDLPSLKDVFSSGEKLSLELVHRFYKVLPECKLHNLYGPTECTIDVSWHDCAKEDQTVPIGKSTYWTKLKVLDHMQRELPPGEKGELNVYGKLVGQGYLGEYCGGFYTDSNGEKAYKTGDIASVNGNGELEYFGRRDEQKKINGIRIDLAQIESLVSEIPGIIQCGIIVKNKQIICFYMADQKLSELREYLVKKLPHYSLPNRFIFCKNIPLTKNGKLDKKYLESQIVENKTEYKSKKEKYLCKYISYKSGISILPESNIFLEGIDSITLIEIIYDLEKKGLYFTPEDFYRAGTIRKLLDNQKTGTVWLTKEGREDLVVAFPYAAGSPKDFSTLARELKSKKVDFLVAHSSSLLPDLQDYKRIVVLGYCTGSANALSMLEKRYDNIVGLVICAASPPGGIGKIVGPPWKFFTDDMLERFLILLHRKDAGYKSGLLKTFRNDVKKFYKYFNGVELESDIPFRLILGGKDPLTYPNVISKGKWKKYFKGPSQTTIIKNRGHFFINEDRSLIAKNIMELLN